MNNKNTASKPHLSVIILKWEEGVEATLPANIRLDEDVLKTSFLFVFRRLLQDVLIKTNIFAYLIRLQKTSSRRLQDILIKTNIIVLVIRLQDVFKTSLRRLQDVLPRHPQNVFKTSCKNVFKISSRRLQYVFKTSSRHLQDVLQRSFQDVFKTYHQVKLFLLTRFQNVSEMYCKDGYL